MLSIYFNLLLSTTENFINNQFFFVTSKIIWNFHFKFLCHLVEKFCHQVDTQLTPSVNNTIISYKYIINDIEI